MLDFNKYIRLLAKSNNYQVLFSFSRESNVNLFENNKGFTKLQILFINYLLFYKNLYTDIALREVSDVVLKDFIYEDSYTYFKNQKEALELKKETLQSNSQGRGKNQDVWVFNTPKRGRQ